MNELLTLLNLGLGLAVLGVVAVLLHKTRRIHAKLFALEDEVRALRTTEFGQSLPAGPSLHQPEGTSELQGAAAAAPDVGGIAGFPAGDRPARPWPPSRR